VNRYRIVPRFPRTLDEAFRTPRYGTAIEYYTRPPLWRRIVAALWRFW
jgi:hypothetical protein